jgi:hypothetical protein
MRESPGNGSVGERDGMGMERKVIALVLVLA